MPLFSDRLPHVLSPSNLAQLLTPTYARETGISDDLALERLQRALKSAQLADQIYAGVSTALTAVQGSRPVDAVVDALSKGVPKGLDLIKAAPRSPALSAVTVCMNIELGLASQGMAATLESERGQIILKQGFDELGTFLVKSLVR